ncbi:ATP-dependent Clp protease proteolytic subunit [Serratia ureilytica]
MFFNIERMKRTKDRVIRLYAQYCGLSDEAVERALDRDRFMTADEAAAWGLIDKVLHER